MEEGEKQKYQICDVWSPKAFFIDWDKLKEEMIAKIPSYMFYNVLSYSPEKQLYYRTIVYFRPVKKFRKNITEFEINGSIFGI